MVKAKEFEFFKDIDEDNPLKDLKYVKKSYKKGETVVKPSDSIHSIGFIIEGFLEALNYSYDGEKITSTYFSPNEIFPEYLYFSGENEFPYTLISLEASTIAWVKKDDFEDALNKSKKAMRSLIEYLSKRGLYNQLIPMC
jgi:CRP-like cAMP-binding protein